MENLIKGIIEVSGLKYFIPIGYYTHEQAFPVEVEIGFKIFLDYPGGHEIKDLDDTVSYEPFIDAINKALKNPEPLIEQIALSIKKQFSYIVQNREFKIRIKAFEVSVEKKEILIPGPGISPTAKVTIKWEI